MWICVCIIVCMGLCIYMIVHVSVCYYARMCACVIACVCAFVCLWLCLCVYVFLKFSYLFCCVQIIEDADSELELLISNNWVRQIQRNVKILKCSQLKRKKKPIYLKCFLVGLIICENIGIEYVGLHIFCCKPTYNYSLLISECWILRLRSFFCEKSTFCYTELERF